jgi:cytochrome c oxidase subunit 3
MTLALAPAAPVAPRRQLLVAVGVASAGVATLMGTMLATWLRFRADAPLRESEERGLIRDWLPANIAIPEVAANVMWITFFAVCVMAQWAVYAAKRGDSAHRSTALALSFGLGLAALNAQVAVWIQMGIGISDGLYQNMFYAVTGTMAALVVSGMAFSAVAWFRSVGGRLDDTRVVAAHALYWYVLTAAFTAVWFVVYVQK